MSTTLLSVKGINKSFPGVKALSNVSFSMGAGQIHALMGENGAGKSTLIKVLTGVYRSDSGELEFDGQPIAPESTRDVEGVGISTVYQEVNLIPHLSVAENITLGRQAKRFGFIDWKSAHARAEKALARLNVNIDVKSQLSSLSVAQQQLVAIARALDINAKMLILDEPTASLDEGEVQQLFEILVELKKSGLAIIFITHFLDEVYQVSDVISILRNGEFVGQYPTKELPKLDLIGKMLGKEFNSADETGADINRENDQDGSEVSNKAKDKERSGWLSAENLASSDIDF